VLLSHRTISDDQLLSYPLVLLYRPPYLISLQRHLADCLPQPLALDGHVLVLLPELCGLLLSALLLSLVSPHHILHVPVVTLHKGHLISQLLKLDLERLSEGVSLVKFVCELLILTRKRFDLVLGGNVQLGHFLLEELDLDVLLLHLILQEALLVGEEFLAR
jgi:hypothetical protein